MSGSCRSCCSAGGATTISTRNIYYFEVTVFRVEVLVLVRDYVGLFDFGEHFLLVLANQVDVHVDHLVVLAVDVDGVQGAVFVVVDDARFIGTTIILTPYFRCSAAFSLLYIVPLSWY